MKFLVDKGVYSENVQVIRCDFEIAILPSVAFRILLLMAGSWYDKAECGSTQTVIIVIRTM
jgi:hypothetical protein